MERASFSAGYDHASVLGSVSELQYTDNTRSEQAKRAGSAEAWDRARQSITSGGSGSNRAADSESERPLGSASALFIGDARTGSYTGA